jgi:2-dehydro-3-deoxyphosphogluconate aldolase / (4S)-4-hydroxy-2-oxoglutarate aldolase
MTRQDAISLLEQHRLLAILRGDFRDNAVALAGILVEAGIRVLEVSTVSKSYAEVIRSIVDAFGKQVAVGAGTVLTLEHLRDAADAGAVFVVSPGTNPAVIAETRRINLASFPGALTPTEILLAMESGADAVKLFPASAFGPSYLRALRGPFPSLRVIPTGGIHTGNLREYLDQGAWAVAVGSEMVRGDQAEPDQWAELRSRAEKFVALTGGGKR